MELSLLTTNGDERAGLPSASDFSRLLKCRASFLLTKRAYELGQVAHERSAAADLGTKKHLANVEGPEILLPRERESWELCRAKRDAFVKSWIGDSDSPVQSIQEERLWLRKGIRPLLSGKPDEVLRQGARACVIDHKFGSYRVEDPVDNQQLAIYALLVSRDDTIIEEVTAQILSPYFDFEPVVYGREELDRLYQSTLVVVSSLDDPGDAVPGDHCHFCPARLICSAARTEAENATLAKVIELPLGEGAAKLLEQIKRAQSLFKEVESHYKHLLEETPGAIPGWMLEPGDVRRSIEDTLALHERTSDQLSLEELLSCCSPSVPALERMWAKKNGIPANQAKDGFKQFLGPLLVEKRTAPSLRRAGE
jgi:CRISPR/Cas system-associated exonuclease Cas4 (RecB family)